MFYTIVNAIDAGQHVVDSGMLGDHTSLQRSDVRQSLGSALAKAFVTQLREAFPVHELSIANCLVEIALEHAQASGNVRVQQINLRIGALSCVHRDALLFGFDLVVADTALAGAKLHITDLPVVIYCPRCEALRELPGVQAFHCPVCQTPSADIRQGQELDIESIEVVDLGASRCSPELRSTLRD